MIGPGNTMNRPKRKRPLAAIAIVALAIGVVVGIGWFLTRTPSDAPAEREHKRSKRIKEVKPSLPNKTAPAETNTKLTKVDEHEGMVKSSIGVWQPTNRPWRAERRKVHAVHTNGANRVRQPLPYHNATEQLLLQTFGREVGLAPFPLLKLPKKDMDNLVSILMSDNPVSEKDSEETALSKEIITEAKAEMRKFIKNGGNPDEFFEHYHSILRQAYDKRQIAKKEILRIASQEKDPDLARMLQKEVNDKLIEEGIKPLKLDLPDDFE